MPRAGAEVTLGSHAWVPEHLAEMLLADRHRLVVQLVIQSVAESVHHNICFAGPVDARGLCCFPTNIQIKNKSKKQDINHSLQFLQWQIEFM